MKFSAAILAGGESSRMGRDKTALTYNGVPFIRLIADQLAGFNELLLSVAAPREDSFGLTQVCDSFSGNGPMAGLYSALDACKSEALLVVPCDFPLFTRELGEYLCSCLTDEYDVAMPVSFSGQEHPLCAVYRKSLAPLLKSSLERGNSNIKMLLDDMNVNRVNIWEAGFADRLLANINTPEQYACLCGAAIKNIFLTGEPGVGKSSVIEETSGLLNRRLGGFVTTFLNDREGKKALYMLAPEETMVDMSAHIVACCEEDAAPNVGRFNTLGCYYLSDNDAELVIMDELGSLETEALDFRRAVSRMLDSHIPVLGALHDTDEGWTRDIPERFDVRIVHVTRENRQTLPVVLANMISSIRPVICSIRDTDKDARRAV